MTRYDYDMMGQPLFGPLLGEDRIAGMHRPVRCLRCHGGVYDLGTVEVTARYVDCSMWHTPCCGALVDDRGETGWKSQQDYKRVDRNGGAW